MNVSTHPKGNYPEIFHGHDLVELSDKYCLTERPRANLQNVEMYTHDLQIVDIWRYS